MLIKCWVLLLVLPSVCFGQGDELASIIKISSSQTKSVGDNVEFECVVKNLNDYKVVWEMIIVPIKRTPNKQTTPQNYIVN